MAILLNMYIYTYIYTLSNYWWYSSSMYAVFGMVSYPVQVPGNCGSV